jgi:hypothetical protein
MNRQGSDHPGSSFQSHGEGHQQTNNGGEAEHPQQMQEEGGAAGRTILPVGRGSRESSARQSYDRRIRHRTPLVDHSPRPSPGRPRSTINDTRWQSLNGRPAGQRGLDGRRPSSRSSSITSTTSRLGSAATRADGGSPSALAHIWRTGPGTARPSVTSSAPTSSPRSCTWPARSQVPASSSGGEPSLYGVLGRGPVACSVLSSPLSSRARRSLPRRRRSTPSARRRSATWRLRRGSPCR